MNKNCVCGVNDIKQNISNTLSCKSCSLVIQNSVASADNKRCGCSSSTMLNLFGNICVSECSTNELFNSSINQCVCTVINNTCTCNSTSISFKNTCYQCESNKVSNVNATRYICEVALSLNWMRCVPECSPNEHIVNKRSMCINDLTNGTCAPNKAKKDFSFAIVGFCGRFNYNLRFGRYVPEIKLKRAKKKRNRSLTQHRSQF
ncbi:Hypothetical_protein [Hexamita inflata]|uniref:Hypothetical_protein n=1 Tax=Hexamita inflata TaxID=28002 RepID=A0AA86TV72_9EUKA|nr:Hypothetical protein HINF_LOCUS17775 [Hexamita inflata]